MWNHMSKPPSSVMISHDYEMMKIFGLQQLYLVHFLHIKRRLPGMWMCERIRYFLSNFCNKMVRTQQLLVDLYSSVTWKLPYMMEGRSKHPEASRRHGRCRRRRVTCDNGSRRQNVKKQVVVEVSVTIHTHVYDVFNKLKTCVKSSQWWRRFAAVIHPGFVSLLLCGLKNTHIKSLGIVQLQKVENTATRARAGLAGKDSFF